MKRSIWMIVLAFSTVASAQQGQFFASVTSDSVLAGNILQVTFVADNIAGTFDGPTLDGLKVISGPNTSTTMSVVNGAVSQKATYSYSLMMDEIGEFVIPPAYLDTADGALETEPLEILVVPNPEGIIEQPPSQSGFFEFDFPSRVRPTPTPPTPPQTPARKRRKLKKI